MDLLARHNAPRPSEDIDLGDGLFIRRARRPRARRVRNEKFPAYDARQVFLEDKASHTPSYWRLAAMLYGLIEAIQVPPTSDTNRASIRSERIAELIRLIEARGLNFQYHILPSLRSLVAALLHIEVLRAKENEIQDFVHIDTWVRLAEEYMPETELRVSKPGEAIGESLGLLLMAIMRWASSADADELLNWLPPDQLCDEGSLPIDVVDSDSRRRMDYRTLYLDLSSSMVRSFAT